jgi:polysaccharide deacetylase family protein (PEP-CTERM system associated)
MDRSTAKKNKKGLSGTLVVCGALAALLIHAWLLKSGIVPAGVGLASFGALCLFLSFVQTRSDAPGHPAMQQQMAGQQSSAQPQPISIAPRSEVAARSEIQIAARATAQTPAAAGIWNAFTIDLEDYFHTEVASSVVPFSKWDAMPSRIPATVPRLLDQLDKHKVRSTVFVLGWVARKHPALVREIAARGHEIACHSNLHRAVFRLDAADFYQDTMAAKRSIEDAAGQSVRGYRAPSFSITPGTEWAFDILGELGFQYDSSVNPVRHKFYGNPDAPRVPYEIGKTGLLEIPIATWRVAGRNLPVGGGAYLRLLPYSYINAGLKSINNREGRPFTVYMHPWEIDSFESPLNLKWTSKIRQTWGTKSMDRKLDTLLSSFKFAPIWDVYSSLMPASKSQQTGEALAMPRIAELAS